MKNKFGIAQVTDTRAVKLGSFQHIILRITSVQLTNINPLECINHKSKYNILLSIFCCVLLIVFAISQSYTSETVYKIDGMLAEYNCGYKMHKLDEETLKPQIKNKIFGCNERCMELDTIIPLIRNEKNMSLLYLCDNNIPTIPQRSPPILSDKEAEHSSLRMNNGIGNNRISDYNIETCCADNEKSDSDASCRNISDRNPQLNEDVSLPQMEFINLLHLEIKILQLINDKLRNNIYNKDVNVSPIEKMLLLNVSDVIQLDDLERPEKYFHKHNILLKVKAVSHRVFYDINKPDISFVIHYKISQSIQKYYQESSRARRDGKESPCILLYKSSDCFNKIVPMIATAKDPQKLIQPIMEKSFHESETFQNVMRDGMYVRTVIVRRNYIMNVILHWMRY